MQAGHQERDSAGLGGDDEEGETRQVVHATQPFCIYCVVLLPQCVHALGHSSFTLCLTPVADLSLAVARLGLR